MTAEEEDEEAVDAAGVRLGALRAEAAAVAAARAADDEGAAGDLVLSSLAVVKEENENGALQPPPSPAPGLVKLEGGVKLEAPGLQLEALGLKLEPSSVKAEPFSPQAEPLGVKAEPAWLKLEPGAVKAEPGLVKAEPGAVKAEPGLVKAEAEAAGGWLGGEEAGCVRAWPSAEEPCANQDAAASPEPSASASPDRSAGDAAGGGRGARAQARGGGAARGGARRGGAASGSPGAAAPGGGAGGGGGGALFPPEPPGLLLGGTLVVCPTSVLHQWAREIQAKVRAACVAGQPRAAGLPVSLRHASALPASRDPTVRQCRRCDSPLRPVLAVPGGSVRGLRDACVPRQGQADVAAAAGGAGGRAHDLRHAGAGGAARAAWRAGWAGAGREGGRAACPAAQALASRGHVCCWGNRATLTKACRLCVLRCRRAATAATRRMGWCVAGLPLTVQIWTSLLAPRRCTCCGACL
jgi:hypothetical protein